MTIAQVSKTSKYSNLTQIQEVKQIIFKDISRIFNITLKPFNKITESSNNFDSKEVNKIVNHPIHIIENTGELSPSAFIPFCYFGDWIGVKIDEFEVPVCTGFQATILNDQLCYKIDLNNLAKNSSSKDYKQGFTFYVDTNQDRQINTSTGESEFMIYLDTVGMYHRTYKYV